MSDRATDSELARDVAALIRTLEDLQDELAPGERRRLGLPTPRDLLRFTSEVSIPAAILVLETNVRVLRLLQRTIRMSTGEDSSGAGGRAGVRERASTLGRDALRGLDATLSELETAVDGTPPSDDAASLLAEARRLRDEVDARLAADQPAAGAAGVQSGLDETLDREPVDVDVEAELRSIKDEIDDEDGGADDGSDGNAGEG